MKILFYEYVTGGGLAGSPLPPRLVHEADLMVRALVNDLGELPGIEVLVARDPRLPPLAGPRVIEPLRDQQPFSHFLRAARQADAVWLTAPELGGTLLRLVRSTLDLGRRVLGSDVASTEIASSKHRTAQVLAAGGIPVVPTATTADEVDRLPGCWVVKPDDGAGCEGLTLVEGWSAARERLLAGGGNLVAQPWVEGDPRSLSLLCRDGDALLLASNRQEIAIGKDGVATLMALEVNRFGDPDGSLADLARRIAQTLPGLWGYVGVDYLETASGPVVLEINPRLTTSCCGLRPALGLNLASLVLALDSPGALAVRGRVLTGEPYRINLVTSDVG